MLLIKTHYKENVDASGSRAIQKDFQNIHLPSSKSFVLFFFQ